MEIVAIRPRVWLLPGSVNMGLVDCGAGLVAIDTGLDKQAGKRLLRAAAELGLPLIAIINTHAHADHYGGNRTVLAESAATVYAPTGEAAVMRRPLFEPEYLWQGAKPFAALQNKFLLADPTIVDVEFTPGDALDIGDVTFGTVSLPGHAHQQAGILVEGVLFAADAYFDVEVVNKHGIPYLVDHAATVTSARKVVETAADWYIPGHGQATQQASPAVHHLLTRLEAVFEQVVRAADGCGLDAVLATVCRQFELQPGAPGSHLLLRTPVAACLTRAIEEGTVAVVLQDGEMLFQSTINRGN